MNKKITIILIVVLLALTGGLLIIYELNKEDDDTPPAKEPTPIVETKNLILENVSTWHYADGSWSNATTSSLEDKAYFVYNNNRYLGEYRLKYGTTWNLFDDYDNYVNYDGSLIAYSTNFNIEVKNIVDKEISIEEISEISSIIGYDIDIVDLSLAMAVTAHLDNSGNIDKIVSVSNLDAETEQSIYFNLVYVKKNGKIDILINERIPVTDIFNAPNYTIKNVLNIEESDVASIIVQKGYFSEAGKTGNIIFEYSANKYTKTYED